MRRPRRVSALLATISAAIGLCAAAPGVRAAALPTTHVRVGSRPVARPLPTDFLSVSIQFRTVLQWAGAGHGPVPRVLVRLIRGLDPSGHSVIRIGGQGGDRTWWPTSGLGRPPGVSFTLSPRWIRAARRVATALRARYQLQVNLEAGDPRIAHVEAEHFLHGLGASKLAALEIGNEPDLYRSIPWYWEQDGEALPWYADRGTPLFSRDASYGPAAFVAQWHRFAKVLPGDVPARRPRSRRELVAVGVRLGPAPRLTAARLRRARVPGREVRHGPRLAALSVACPPADARRLS